LGVVKRFFLNWWTLTIAAAVLVALLLAVGLPIFVGFLRPWWVRLLVVLAVALIWGVFALIHVLSARRANDAIAEELAKPESAGDEEARNLAKRMAEALAGFKKASGDKRDYLYSRPWYVIIGPPGAGKTTALLNSGLRFPFADSALKGVGGTRNLDFWFADEAALVDTAGRYTTQDSDTPTDAKAWESFLGLLRKHRPLQPINGVLVAIGIDELLRADRSKIDAHASAVRRRLQELRRTLEVAAPIYVLFTKADLLAGFVEFYEDLDVEGRRAVVGATLPWGKALSADTLAIEFDGFVQSIADRSAKRLQEEPDARRRGLILGYPPQVEGLRSRVLRFLEGAFLAERGQQEPLRGFYMTSGVQEGAPLDRILSGMAQVYDQPRSAHDSQGRAYFLNRLLGDVIFAEAGLVQTDPKARARRMAQLMAGFAVIGAITLITLVLWIVSFAGNRHLQNGVFAGAQDAQQKIQQAGIQMIEVRDSDTQLDQTLDSLNALRNLPGGYAERQAHGPPLFSRFGLYQHGLSKQAQQTYLVALRRVLLPRIMLRLEAYLRTNQAQPLNMYEPLKVYLMLGGRSPKGVDVAAVKAWVENDWATNVYPGDDRGETRKELGQHLDALLSAPEDLSTVWPNNTPPMDGALIASATQAVQSMTLADRAYAILRQKNATGGQPWQAGTVLASGAAPAFANGNAVLSLSVPYFFTRQGYDKAYLIGLQTVEQDLKNDLWVLGTDANTTSIQTQLGGVRSGVASDYARDYNAAWEGVVKALLPADYFHNAQALAAFTATPSPLKVVLLEVVKNTTFTGGAAGAAQGALQQKLSALPGAQAFQAGAVGVDAGRQISTNFAPIKTYVGDGNAPAPIDDFVTALKNVGQATASAAAASSLGAASGATTAASLAPALAAVNAAAAGAPALLQGFTAQAAKGGAAAATSTAQGAVAAAYTQNLAQPCNNVVQNHYPFFAGAADAQVSDILPVFGMNGQFDSFSKTQLSSLLDESGPVWRWQASNAVAATLDPVSAEQLHRAAELRDLLASGQPIQVEAASFGSGVTSAEFSAGGAINKFDPTTAGARPVMWSISAVPEAHVTLYSGTKVVNQFSAAGPWALFKLMDAAAKENSGPTAFKATFGQGATSAAFKISLPSDHNPFSRGGLWSFRCPAKL
jgi:type VI secretion system protein ImpL